MTVRAKPAASIIAIWHDLSGAAHVLMGQRAQTLAFLPGYLVFPGGRVEAKDKGWSKNQKKHALDPGCMDVLNAESPLSGQILLSAAGRECREEAGIDILAKTRAPVRYIARAITPAHLPIRYDTRFFLAEIVESSDPPKATSVSDDELDNVSWFSAADLEMKPLHAVTHAVLVHALKTLSDPHLGRLLIADRKPKAWFGPPAIRSRTLKASL